mmetsp:Transcript_42295/g.88117  ORF Transcript_42295/g.88117 Transcript_42295/m.88117 type:complete len:651 (+) Transcript_42295:77-2029(+)
MNFIKDLSIDKIQNLAEDAFNQAKPKTDVEARVYEVLSHKNWGASGSLMNEIARDTYDMERFQVVSALMWDGMENQRPAAWKVVFKSLNLLEHLVKNGAERCVDDARNHGHVLRALGQFNYYEGTIDRGLGVREKSKQVLEMLTDDDRVREERQKARKLREKFGNFNKGASGIGGGGGGNTGGKAGYGNQDSWNTGSGGSGYGEGGIYDNDKAYSGRYGNSSSTTADATPTFAAMPGEKKKSKKKKKKQAAKPEPVAAAPAQPAVIEDLLGFDSVPAPAPTAAAGGNADFGSFQAPPAPTPAATGGSDDFAEFDQIRSKKETGPDPFVAAPAVPTVAQGSFNAFGNNNTGATNNNMMNNNMMMNKNMMMNNNNMNNNMAAMGNAFNNMSVGTSALAGGMQQPAMGAVNDDDFGDFAAATNTAPPVSTMSMSMSKPLDPMAGLINLDGLSKNNSTQTTKNQPVVVNAAAAQYQHDIQNGVQASVVVSAGGSDAISSMMGPTPPKQQMGSNFSMNPQGTGGSSGMPSNPQMQQQNQFNMNQGMQGGGMNNMMGGNPQMQGSMMHGNQMGGAGMMNNTNQMGMNQMGMNQMGMNQMGGQQMNQMNPQMMGNMGMQGNMNQMGGMQGGMNQMGGQMMGNMGMQGGMGGQQQSMR